MKSLIIAITLLLSSAALAQTAPEQITLSPTEFAGFVQLNINRGLTSDTGVYTGYLTKTFNHGTIIENVTIAMRYSYCSIIWRNIIELAAETKELKHEMLKHSIWRAIEMAKWFTSNVDADPAKVETTMIPLIATRDAVISDATIYNCTALDVAGYQQLSINEYDTRPPKDWTIEPIPEIKLPSIPSGTAS